MTELILPPSPIAITPALPSLQQIEKIAQLLKPHIISTPCCRINIPTINCDTWAKMEIWQSSGSFKIRGALYSLMQLTKQQQQAGVITASAGNHALALSLAAQYFNISVKVLMPRHADKEKIALCEKAGAEIVLADDFVALFKQLKLLQQKENKTLVHPFEGPHVSAATATLGLEIAQQLPNLDVLVVAIGGGGLISGVSYAMKTLQPNCQIMGVEPFGAVTLSTSFQNAKPCKLTELSTIAQSLSAPEALPYSYSVCTNYVDAIVNVNDDEILNAMHSLFTHMKLAVEPAAAASLAAIIGPLQSQLANKKVGFILCGSNMSYPEFKKYMDKSI